MKEVPGGKKVTIKQENKSLLYIERRAGRAKEHFSNKFTLIGGKKLEGNKLWRKVQLQKQRQVDTL